MSEWLVEEFEGYWDREQALWFLLTDEAPSAEPIFAEIRPLRVGKHLSYGRLILQVEPWVPAETVTNYYRQFQVLILGHIPRALSLRNLELARFVLNHLRHLLTPEARGKGVSGMPSWRELMMRWNKAHPKMAYDNQRLFHRDFFEPLGAWCVPSARGKDRTLMKEHKSLGKVIRDPLAEREGQANVGGVSYHPAVRPPPPKLCRGDRD